MSTYTENIPLKDYSKGEELANSISHGIGAVFTIVAMILMLTKGEMDGTKIAAILIMNLSMLLVYTTSTVYHALPHGNAKRILRVLDHSFIFLAVIGSLFPFVLISLQTPTAYWILAATSLTGVLGIIFTVIGFKKYLALSLAMNFIAGATAMVIFFLLRGLASQGITLLVLSGASYAVGAILYLIGRKKKYIHSVFHVFILIGNVFMLICIYLYVLPVGSIY